MNLFHSSIRRLRAVPRRLRLLLLFPALFVSCGSVFQGPVVGRITLEHPADAVDAVVFLRCRGAGLHGDITTDAEHTRAGPDGRFVFLGSLTFPTTEHCYLYVRHPRYQTVRVELADVLVQKLEPIALTTWDRVFKAGPDEKLRQGARNPWPQGEVYGHLSDTLLWLRSFPPGERKKLAAYIPVIHDIYRQAYHLLSPENTRLRNMLRLIGILEEETAFPYPFSEYLQAVKAGDARKVRSFIEGGVLRETRYRGRSSTLSVAAAEGHLEVMDVLLAHDEPLHIEGCGSPLLAALRANRWPAALKLIDVGIGTDVFCNDHRPVGDAMASFARSERLDLLQSFIDAGVPVDAHDSQNTTALGRAAAEGKIQSVKLLLAAGARPDVRTRDGVPLVEDAVAKGYLDVERELRLAMAVRQGGPASEEDVGETISLPWRRGDPASYTVYSSYGQVNDIVADPRQPGILWLATAGGLLRVNPESGEQRAWSRVSGLPASAVQDIWFDTAGNYLWVATGAGLARLPLDEMQRVEKVGSGEPRSSYASGFVAGQPAGSVWYQASQGLYRLEVESSEARRYTFEPSPFDAVAIPQSADFFVSDSGGVWRFDSRSGKRQPVVDSEALAAHVDIGPSGPPLPRSLALDASAGTLWIGCHGHGLFSMDVDSGRIDRPSLSAGQVEQCGRSSASPQMHGEVFLAGGATYAQLGRCFGRIDNNSFVVLGDRIDAGPVEDARGDVWWLADGQFHRLDANGDSTMFPRRPDPIDNARVNATFRIGERLFVGVQDAPLAVLHLENRTWSKVPRVTNVQRLRTVAANEQLLALGQAHYYWVDPQALTARELLLGPGSTGFNNQLMHWQDLRDLEFDGEIMWVLRDNRRRRPGKSRVGLYRVARDGYKSYDSASGYYLGELARVVQDPSDSGRLWLLQNSSDGLIDFDKATEGSQLIGKNSSKRGESELLATAMSDPRLKTLTTKRHETLDPDDPELVWGVASTGVYLKRGNRIIKRWSARLPTGPIEVIRDAGTTVWIASSEGLIEYPIEVSLTELKQKDAATSEPGREIRQRR